MEEGGTHDTKVSDSGYSNSCSNSQSQRSSGSSESRHSSSSGSSGYRGHQSDLGSINESGVQQQSKRKEKDYKKKKCKEATQEQSASPQTGDNCERSGAETPSTESEAVHVATLAHTLSCIKKLKNKGCVAEEGECGVAGQSGKVDKQTQDRLMRSLNGEPGQEEEFSVVVSLRDGVVVCTTSDITDILGYPKDMWIGRSLVDFIHPKHRVAFATHITSVIAAPAPGETCEGNGNNKGINNRRNSFFCSLRQYRGLRCSGFSVTDKPVSYLPCQLTTSFRELAQSADPNNKIYLVVTANAVRSAYKYEEEDKNQSVKFMTRHLATSCVSHVDPEVIPYFGYLPQDMIGRSIFDFYHHEDLQGIKEVYQAVMKEQSKPVQSKPYRFKCQNGGFAVVETEYSTFINPWTHKMEFIIGRHSVLRGPPDPDVTTPVDEEPIQLTEAAKSLQEEMKALMNEIVIVPPSDSTKQQVSKRCKDLASFMESLVESKPPDLKVDVLTEERSFSERDSVMLGEISPHHDYYNSNSSSGTPPSYNQLNYNDNLQRFFESKPKTTLMEESGERKREEGIPSTSSEEDKGSRSVVNNSSQASTLQEQRSSCFITDSGTSCGQSTETNSNGKEAGGEGELYTPLALTEQLLTKHNEDMEKQMMQKHRELRNKCEGKGKERQKNGEEKPQAQEEEAGGCHGVKRSGSHSWEGEPYKSIKTRGAGVHPSGAGKPLNLWPPFSVGVVPLHPQQPRFTTAPVAGPILPMYYIPEPPRGHPAYLAQRVSGVSGVSAVPYMPDMVYHPVAMLGAPPVVYSPLAVLPGAVLHEDRDHQEGDGKRGSAGGDIPGGDRPRHRERIGGSRGTSLKAEPGSALCSFTSASFPQQLSEKGKTVSSRGSPTWLSPPVDRKLEADNLSSGGSNIYDDSSIYSSFYSFLKTDKSDQSMRSFQENEAKTEEMLWEKSARHGDHAKPIKKVAPWLEEINMTTEAVLKYRVEERDLNKVLEEDLSKLKKTKQPSTVNEQLSQMYVDLQLEGLSRQLTLEEGPTSSSESSGEESVPKQNKKTRFMEYDKMVIMFEENAPMPPPDHRPRPTACN